MLNLLSLSRNDYTCDLRGLNPTWDNTLYDPQIVVLSLDFLCVRFMYSSEVLRDTE